jgi:hypothetical protein
MDKPVGIVAMKIFNLTVFCLLGFNVPLASAAIWQITYPSPVTDFDQRSQYPVKLLSLALDQTSVKYRIAPSEKVLQLDRAISLLTEKREINVIWTLSNDEREKKMLPIRIPIYKGLIGWRMFMIKESRAEDFKKIKNLQQLTQLKPIHVLAWADTKILQSNGFDVVTSRVYKEVFTMLNQQQGDFLPRSLTEISAEMTNNIIADDIIIEPTLGVRYPAAMYFFVNANDKILAKLLTDGLEKAIENGEFDTLFNLEFGVELEQANLEERFFYELDNPFLPISTPLERRELWYK